jgi:hypothetical protein
LKEDGNIEFKTGKLKKLSGMLRGFFISWFAYLYNKLTVYLRGRGRRKGSQICATLLLNCATIFKSLKVNLVHCLTVECRTAHRSHAAHSFLFLTTLELFYSRLDAVPCSLLNLFIFIALAAESKVPCIVPVLCAATVTPVDWICLCQIRWSFPCSQ